MADNTEELQMSEVDLYKIKYFNELVSNKKAQLEKATEELQNAFNALISTASENKQFEVVSINLDKGTISRKKIEAVPEVEPAKE